MDLDHDIYVANDGPPLRPNEPPNGTDETVNPSLIFGAPLPLKDGPQLPPSPHDPSLGPFTEPAGEPMIETDPPSESDDSSDEAADVATSNYRQRAMVVINAPKPKSETLPYSSSRSGLVYDVRMRFHTEPLDAMLSEDDIHPEDPRRIMEIFNELAEAGLVETPSHQVADPDFSLWRINARPATEEEVCLVHTRDHYSRVRAYQNYSQEILNEMAADMDSVYLHPATYSCASLSAGGAIEAARAVVAGHVRNAVAVIRPPGHHAEHDAPGGFCFFNNVSVAARVCQQDFPDKCRKILILDWDVHHGNGVQRAFYNDPNVLYISIHVHMNGTFYPSNNYGDHTHCGEGPGEGKNVNIPWSAQGMGDGDYMYAFQQIVMPIAQEFDPDLVIVASGFDAADGDRLGKCFVTPPCYAHMTHMLMSLASGKTVVCLEGGYNLQSIARSAVAVTRTLMGEPPDRLGDEIEPSPLGLSTVELVKRYQSRYWKCMYPKQHSGAIANALHARRIHDIVRQADATDFWNEYRMTELFILRDKISKSFEKQVLATHNFAEERPLLVIFHEPPETTALTDPRSKKISLHNIFVTDVTKTYVEWAVKNGFGVIDVNIPEHITDPNGLPEYADADPDEARGLLTRELATYLWENYISLGENTHKFFMGVGAAYGGILDLLGENDDCSKETDHTFAFIAENSLQSIKKLTDDYIGDWYYNNSHIYVANNHAAWDPTRQRKLRKKYGYVIRSPHSDLSNMLEEHRDVVTDTMLQSTEEWREEQAAAAKLRAAEEAQNPIKRHHASNSAAYSHNSSMRGYDSNGTGGPTSAAGSNVATADGTANGGSRRNIRHTSLPAPAADPRSTPTIRSPSGHTHPRGPPLGNFTITPTRRAGSGSVSPGKRARGE
ncbi:histone deacetylase [Diplodia corticola]|uniref:histone deacetylase n=1 Tax=Diplodia corticola TaxID=236234 RepID=A0A1J9QKW4_9PEZI|nr:histone deacetylase [Diplodia corticola]OJD28706.1 histone deacetylase [Diplodia corticola]